MSTVEVKTQKFIIKFFPEIMIKGSTAKRQMVNQLHGNLLKLLARISADIKLKKFYDKIEVVAPLDYVVETRIRLLDTPGIELVLEALQFDKVDTLDQIKVIVNEHMAKEIEGKSFVVRAKRSGTHDFKSTNVEQTVGGYMLAHSNAKKVDLHNPEVTINVESYNLEIW